MTQAAAFGCIRSAAPVEIRDLRPEPRTNASGEQPDQQRHSPRARPDTRRVPRPSLRNLGHWRHVPYRQCAGHRFVDTDSIAAFELRAAQCLIGEL